MFTETLPVLLSCDQSDYCFCEFGTQVGNCDIRTTYLGVDRVFFNLFLTSYPLLVPSSGFITETDLLTFKVTLFGLAIVLHCFCLGLSM